MRSSPSSIRRLRPFLLPDTHPSSLLTPHSSSSSHLRAAASSSLFESHQLPSLAALRCARFLSLSLFTQQIRAANTPDSAKEDFAAAAGEVTVKQHDLGDCKVRLEVTVPVSVQERAYTACLEGFAEKVQIPGFTYKKGGNRKKKDSNLPPANVIIPYVGEKEFKSACVEEMLQNSIPAAMQTVATTALQDSERIETPFDDLVKAFAGKDCAPVGDVIYGISVEAGVYHTTRMS